MSTAAHSPADSGLAESGLRPLTVLTAAEAASRAAAHAAAVRERTAAHLERRARGEKHPVEDFLFTYYPFTPGQMAAWHPGAGTAVEAPGAAEGATSGADGAAFVAELAARKWYARYTESGLPLIAMDRETWCAARGSGALFIRDLLARTLGREGTFGCFGLHEWAMVYRQTDEEHRHAQVPFRLSREETDAVVEGHRIRCSHFDAFRFFTPEAKPRNELSPARETMREMEQPGCLHGGMDLYKWAMKLGPAVPSAVTLAAFDLARDIRTLDMEASPYDVRGWGYGAVAIETPEGKAEYVRRQRAFAARGNDIRRDLLAALEPALGSALEPAPDGLPAR
ncbi:3-methyladenine DNA glycosylase [Brevibacterium album]|uniref:3-methyladenine DNA glycosylase n=1 Tax=Brevibacterium album TaxID=417948 RepID=UPI001FE1E727|nr:3-methyladenine DNA glycosylase [Brevibacterium album]